MSRLSILIWVLVVLAACADATVRFDSGIRTYGKFITSPSASQSLDQATDSISADSALIQIASVTGGSGSKTEPGNTATNISALTGAYAYTSGTLQIVSTGGCHNWSFTWGGGTPTVYVGSWAVGVPSSISVVGAEGYGTIVLTKPSGPPSCDGTVSDTVTITRGSDALTLTSTPTIAAGTDGQQLTILNASTGSVTIQDKGTLASSGLSLTSATVAIAQGQAVQLVYSSNSGYWRQVGRVHILAADVPTLNQNTTGLAAGLTTSTSGAGSNYMIPWIGATTAGGSGNAYTTTGFTFRPDTGAFAVPGGISGTGLTLNGGTQLTAYDEGSFTGTLTGCTTEPTASIYFVQVGKQVTLSWDQFTGTSNTTGLTMTGLPAALRPARIQSAICSVVDNSAEQFGFAWITASGTVLNFGVGAGRAAFTGSGTKGPGQLSFSYVLN